MGSAYFVAFSAAIWFVLWLAAALSALLAVAQVGVGLKVEEVKLQLAASQAVMLQLAATRAARVLKVEEACDLLIT